MAEAIRANAVFVAKIFQARCTLPRCDWAGELLGSYQEANDDRQTHLEEHRAAPDGDPGTRCGWCPAVIRDNDPDVKAGFAPDGCTGTCGIDFGRTDD